MLPSTAIRRLRVAATACDLDFSFYAQQIKLRSFQQGRVRRTTGRTNEKEGLLHRKNNATGIASCLGSNLLDYEIRISGKSIFPRKAKAEVKGFRNYGRKRAHADSYSRNPGKARISGLFFCNLKNSLGYC